MPKLFFALELPERLRLRLDEEVERLRALRPGVVWVKPENLHVTVCFLGEQDDQAVLALEEIVGALAKNEPPLELVAAGLSAFPDLERPRVLVCGIRGEDSEADPLIAFRRRLDVELRRAGFHREKGVFVPHITLGRVRSDRQLRQVVEKMGPCARREFGHFKARELVLFESRLHDDGSSYTPLFRTAFGG